MRLFENAARTRPAGPRRFVSARNREDHWTPRSRPTDCGPGCTAPPVRGTSRSTRSGSTSVLPFCLQGCSRSPGRAWAPDVPTPILTPNTSLAGVTSCALHARALVPWPPTAVTETLLGFPGRHPTSWNDLPFPRPFGRSRRLGLPGSWKRLSIGSGRLGIAWRTPHRARFESLKLRCRPCGGACRLRRPLQVRGARGAVAAGARAPRPLTLHVFRHLPLVPMRPRQSQGFRFHFGQHDKAAAGGERGSVASARPAPGHGRPDSTPARRRQRRPGGPARPLAGRSAPPPPPGCASGPCAPSSPAAPELSPGREAETGGRRPGGEGARARGLGEGAAAWGADPGEPSSRRAARAAGERCCRRGEAAVAAAGRLGDSRRFSTALVRSGRGGVSLLLSFRPFPAPAPSRSLSQVRSVKFQPRCPAPSTPPARPCTALSSPEGEVLEGRGDEKGGEGGQGQGRLG